ncbi:7-dimethylallyltryptophan synthase [Escovopsis weberi]|uniref:Aromatic prenyltransferase janD n=1 Tax=Escovopsis weberi TaxID=150374 RepID=JAND_ESCWE|nr:7-dimethylallyltryptophan synthase [Escovopsis weberi]DAB41648.1 TPA_exp: aromatic prenyl transferase [Escovopsis weberi]
MADYDAERDSRDIEYWTKHTVPPIASLLRTAGYSPSDQEAQLATLTQHVIPHLGPRPSKANSSSFMVAKGSPFQPQINVSAGKPMVRFSWEPMGLHGGSDRDPWSVETTRHVVRYLSDKIGFSTAWLDAIIAAYAPDPAQYEAMSAILPGWMAGQLGVPEPPPLKRIPFSFLAFDLKGSKAAVKVYLNPQVMELASGVPSTKIALDVLRTLKPAFDTSALDLIDEFLTGRPGIGMTAFDCVEEGNLSSARVKIYLTTPTNSFNTAREYITLGGRINNATTKKYLILLQRVWHLLLQDPEDRDDEYETPVLDNLKLYFSIELKPGMKVPEVKSYVPTWKYVKSDKETVQNYQRIFREIGHPWGAEGRYQDIYEDAFGPADVKHAMSVHTDTSFIYSEDKGCYQTLYFGADLDPE